MVNDVLIHRFDFERLQSNPRASQTHRGRPHDPVVPGVCCVEFRPMSDQELAVQAVIDAQRILPDGHAR
jgi:hypothetical protein